MGRHHKQSMSLLGLLCRLWHVREGDRWLVHGRDEQGGGTTLVLRVCEQGVTLTFGQPGRIVLAPLQAGRLRAGIRDALVALDRPHAAVQQRQAPAHDTQRRTCLPSPQERVRVTLSPSREGAGPLSGALDSVHNLEEFDDNAGDDGVGPVWPDHDADIGPLAA